MTRVLEVVVDADKQEEKQIERLLLVLLASLGGFLDSPFWSKFVCVVRTFVSKYSTVGMEGRKVVDKYQIRCPYDCLI